MRRGRTLRYGRREWWCDDIVPFRQNVRSGGGPGAVAISFIEHDPTARGPVRTAPVPIRARASRPRLRDLAGGLEELVGEAKGEWLHQLAL